MLTCAEYIYIYIYIYIGSPHIDEVGHAHPEHIVRAGVVGAAGVQVLSVLAVLVQKYKY